MSWRALFNCGRILRHPWRLLLALGLLGAATLAALHGWAWYHWHAGQTAMAHYRTDAARSHLRECLRIWPNSVPVHLLAARAERRDGNLVKAEQHIDECRKTVGIEVADDVSFEWALLRAAMGDFSSVEESLQARILSRPADAPLIWEALAAGYRRMCRMPKAISYLDTWLHFEPDNAYVYFLRGEVHRQVGAPGRARDEYRRAVELDPDHDDARRHLARSLVQLNYFPDAVAHLDILLRKTPGDPELSTLLARALHELGQRQEAIDLLDSILRTHPEHGPALRERARIALAAQDFTDAEIRLRRAARVLPYDYEVSWGLHQTLQALGRTDEAKTQLANAQQLKDRLERISEIQTRQMTQNPFDAALHLELGELLLSVGQRESGERWILSALRLEPTMVGAHAALARFYDAQGDAGKAAYHRGTADRYQANRKS